MRTFWMTAIAVALVGSVGCSKKTDGTPASDAPATPVSAAELLESYKANEVKADTLYKGKRLQLTGVVGDIKKDFTDSIYVTIGTGKAFEVNTAHCSFGDQYLKEASELSKGTTVTVDCSCAGLVALSVVMKDCRFVKGAPAAKASPPAAANASSVCAKLVEAGVAKNCGAPSGVPEKVTFGVVGAADGKEGYVMHIADDAGFTKFLAMTNASPPGSALRPFVASETAHAIVMLGKGTPAAVEAKAKAVVDAL